MSTVYYAWPLKLPYSMGKEKTYGSHEKGWERVSALRNTEWRRKTSAKCLNLGCPKRCDLFRSFTSPRFQFEMQRWKRIYKENTHKIILVPNFTICNPVIYTNTGLHNSPTVIQYHAFVFALLDIKCDFLKWLCFQSLFHLNQKHFVYISLKNIKKILLEYGSLFKLWSDYGSKYSTPHSYRYTHLVSRKYKHDILKLLLLLHV